MIYIADMMHVYLTLPFIQCQRGQSAKKR